MKSATSRIPRAVGEAGWREPHLLERTAELGDLDVLVVEEPVLGTHDLDPAAVHAGFHAVDLAERVVTVLCDPEVTP